VNRREGKNNRYDKFSEYATWQNIETIWQFWALMNWHQDEFLQEYAWGNRVELKKKKNNCWQIELWDLGLSFQISGNAN